VTLLLAVLVLAATASAVSPLSERRRADLSADGGEASALGLTTDTLAAGDLSKGDGDDMKLTETAD